MRLILPADIVALLASFALLFSRPVWHHAQTLLVGAILSPGRRTVSAALRTVGLRHVRGFQAYHRVRLEPGGLVEPGRQSSPVARAPGHGCTGGPTGAGHR